MHQLDQIDREQWRLNSRRISLEGELGTSQRELTSILRAQADEADRDPTQWIYQPEFYAAHTDVQQNIQLGIKSDLADIEIRLKQLRTERMELIEKMNAPTAPYSIVESDANQPAT